MVQRDDAGSALIEILAASAVLLLLLLYSGSSLAQVSRDQAAVSRQSVALNLARLELERELALAVANSTAYMELAKTQPTVSRSVPELLGGTVTVTRTQRTSTLLDLEVRLSWVQPSGETESVRLPTAVWKR